MNKLEKIFAAHGVPTLMLSMVVTGVLALLVWWTTNSRTQDLCLTQKSILERQEASTVYQVDSAIVFRNDSKSPQVRMFFKHELPERIAELKKVRKDKNSLGC